MLSTNVIGQASKAAHYFLGLDNYYTQDVKDVQQKTHWYGQGAALLGLTGHVDKAQFRELLAGRLPNGEQLGLRQGDTIKHRPGFDLTFSVPKSVSLLLAFSQDDTLKARVNQAVLDSVKTTLSAIEKKCAQARVTTQGVTRYVDTGQLTMALFQHDLSRANEPQTHIHAVVMNMTPLPSGTWRSLASSRQAYGEAVQGPIQGFMEQVRHQKRFYGLMQRAHLANALKEMGFTLTVDRKNGFFELAGFSDKTLATYSTRAQRIREDLAEARLSGAKAAAMMTTKNRPAKSKADEGTLKQEWQSKADAAGVSPEAELKTLLAVRQEQQAMLDKVPSLNPSTSAREAIAYAIDYLSETTAKMSFNELMNRALHMSLGDGLSISALREALDVAVLEQQLIPVQPREPHTQYVSPQQVAAEKTLLNNLAQTITPMTGCSPHTLPHYLASHEELSQPLRLALETVARSPRPITPIDRPHHANQSDLLGHLAQLGEALEQRVLVLTPTALSARQVKQRFQAVPSAWQTFFNGLRDKKHYLSVSQFFNHIESQPFLPSSLAQTLILVEDAHRCQHQLKTDPFF